jgi:hypothetical protein
MFILMFIPFDWLEYQLFAIVSKFVSTELNKIWVHEDNTICSNFWGIWFLWYCVESRWQKTLAPKIIDRHKKKIIKCSQDLNKKHYFQTLVYILRVMDLFLMAVFQQHREQGHGFCTWRHIKYFISLFSWL